MLATVSPHSQGADTLLNESNGREGGETGRGGGLAGRNGGWVGGGESGAG